MRALLLVLLLAVAAVADDTPWFLGMEGGVYRGLTRVGLGTGTSLAVYGQTPYIIGQDGKIWWADAQGNWKPLDGVMQAQKVVVAPSGALVALGLDGGVYKVDPHGWQRVGLGTGTDLAAGGPLYVLGTDKKVWIYNQEWQPYNLLALGKRIAAAPDGTVYVIGTDNGVYKVGEGMSIARLGLATGQEIAVSAAGEVSIVGMDNGVYVWQSGNWSRLGAGVARLVVWPR